MVTGINTGYYDLNNFNYNNQYGTSPYIINNSGVTPTVFAPTTTDPKKSIEADDGKISFGSKIKNFGKGVVKFFTGMFTDENGKFSLGKTLKTAALAVGIGAVCVLTAGTAVPALIATAGVVASGVGVAKGAYRAATATTDAEAEAAWQSIGSSTTALGLSVAGARAVAKGAHAAEAAAGRYDGAKGLVNGVKDVFVDSGNAIKNSAVGVKNAWQGAAGETVLGKLDAVKNNVVEQGREFGAQVKTNYNNVTTNIKNKISKENESLEAKQAKYQEKANSAKSEAAKKVYQKQADKIQQEIAARNEMNGVKNYQEGKDLIASREAELAKVKGDLKDAIASGDKDAIAQAQKAYNTKAREIRIQKEVLNRRAAETNALEARIDAKQERLYELQRAEKPDANAIADLEAEINTLKSAVEFKTPKTTWREGRAALQDNRLPATQADAKAMIAEDATMRKGSTLQVATQATNEIAKTAINDPAARWLTVENAGTKQHYPEYDYQVAPQPYNFYQYPQNQIIF